MSVEPLTKSYPFYTPYQFAGNKPIAAIDLDGLEEKIVIYSKTNDGKVKTTTYDYNTLQETVQISGSAAMSYPISRGQYMAYKASFYKGFADLKSDFISGYREYTQGISANNKSGYTGPGKGTLSFGVGTNGITLQYDPTPTQKKQESTYGIVKRNLENPDKQTKEALNTMAGYTAMVGLAFGAAEIIYEGPTLLNTLATTSDLVQVGSGLNSNIQTTEIGQKASNTLDNIEFFVSFFEVITGDLSAVPTMLQGLSSIGLNTAQGMEKKED